MPFLKVFSGNRTVGSRELTGSTRNDRCYILLNSFVSFLMKRIISKTDLVTPPEPPLHSKLNENSVCPELLCRTEYIPKITQSDIRSANSSLYWDSSKLTLSHTTFAKNANVKNFIGDSLISDIAIHVVIDPWTIHVGSTPNFWNLFNDLVLKGKD